MWSQELRSSSCKLKFIIVQYISLITFWYIFPPGSTLQKEENLKRVQLCYADLKYYIQQLNGGRTKKNPVFWGLY